MYPLQQIVNNQLVYSIDNSPKKSKISGTKTLKSAQSETYYQQRRFKDCALSERYTKNATTKW